MRTAEETPLLEGNMVRIPPAPFARALSRPNGNRLPQAVGHRGYKAAFPENTLGAFKGAVEVGAHGLETDLHLSKDKVVVLSHDATLKRCFGQEAKIADCDWSYLSTLKTLRQPEQRMPRLADLLEFLGKPEQEHVWLLLDLKMDDDAEELLRRTAETIAEVPTSRPWKERIVLGGWNQNYVDICKEYLPGFPIAYIGASLLYASRFLKQPGVDFNLLQQMLVGPCGAAFLRAARKAERNVYLWTVNDEQWMEWSIRKGVDAVITDDPKHFLEVCKQWEDKPEGAPAVATTTTGQRRSRWRFVYNYGQVVVIQILVAFFSVFFFKRLYAKGRRTQAPVPSA